MVKKLRWGVIGAGGIADRRTIPGMMLSKYAELVAVMEINAELSYSLAQKYNAKYWYTTVDELLQNDEIDAVYIASPVLFHEDQIISAAQAHKHILAEKPIAFNCEAAERALKACMENGVYAGTGFVMRYHSLHKKMKDIISSGKLGKIINLRAGMSCWFPDTIGGWRQNKLIASGGALVDMGIHTIDLFEYIMSAKCNEVFGFCSTKTFNYDIDDSANVLLRFDNDAIAYIDANYNIPDYSPVNRIEIYGEKGSIVAENTIGQTDTGSMHCRFTDTSEELVLYGENTNMYTAEIDSFSLSVLNNEPLLITLEDGIRAQRVVEGAYYSSNSKKSVKI